MKDFIKVLCSAWAEWRLKRLEARVRSYPARRAKLERAQVKALAKYEARRGGGGRQAVAPPSGSIALRSKE